MLQGALPFGRPLEPDRDEGVARELLDRGIAEELEERAQRSALTEPAEGDGGGAAIAGLLVGEHLYEVGDELLAPQGRLDPGIEALAGGGSALLDLDHGPDGGVAQRGVGIEEVGGNAGEVVAPGDVAEGLEGGSPEELVVEQLDERGRCARVSDLAEGVDRRVL
jgi:hypothetical protein